MQNKTYGTIKPYFIRVNLFIVRKYLILLFYICYFYVKSNRLKGGNNIRRFEFLIPIDLYNRISLMAEFYHLSRAKMMIKLLEIGYINMLQNGGYNETNIK